MVISVQMIKKCIDEAAYSEERLLLIVGPPGCGKSKVLRELASMRGGKYLKAETLITQEFFELLPNHRRQQAIPMMDKQLTGMQAKFILLDDIQRLFAPVLNLDPLDLLKKLGRKYTIIAAWPGEYHAGNLILFCNGHKMEYDAGNIRIIEISRFWEEAK